MTACKCPACAVLPAPTYTREWLIECEARALLAMPLGERRKALAQEARAKRRGLIEAEIMRLWREKKGGKG